MAIGRVGRILVGVSRVAIVCGDSGKPIDAIRDATRCLAAALRENGHEADVVLRSGDASWHSDRERWRDLAEVAQNYEVIALQYNPFLYGRRGFAPWLMRDFARLRLSHNGPLVALY